LLVGLFQTNVVMGGGDLIAEEITPLERDYVQSDTHLLDLTILTGIKVIDSKTGQTFWLENHEKPALLYNTDEVYFSLSTNDEIRTNPQSDYILKTSKGTASINIQTGLLNYTPKANATDSDVIYYNIQCNTCRDTSQKTIALSFSTAQKTGAELAQTIDLKVQNYPNPFTEKTMIQYVLNQNGNTHIQLYNTAGSLVKTLKTNEYQKAGTYSFELDANELPSGALYIRIQSGDQKNTQKILKL